VYPKFSGFEEAKCKYAITFSDLPIIFMACPLKALTIFNFLERFPTDQVCQEALEHTRWPDGFVCPRCEHRSARTFPRNGRKISECRGCRHQTHPGVGTIFTDTKLLLRTWFIALYRITQSKTKVPRPTLSGWGSLAIWASASAPPGE